MPRSDVHGPALPRNALLAALPRAEYAGLLHHLEPVSLAIRTVLYQPGQPISQIFFPTAGVVSLLAVRGEVAGIEAGVVGSEGMVGLPVFLGTDRSTGLAIVQVPLEALRMQADDFRSLVVRDSTLHGLLLRFTHHLFCQVSQSVACCSSHPLEQRLCRWLLLVHDRVGTDGFPLTQEFMAAMLGVRRASVNEVARSLQDKGLIRYRRGGVNILDRAGMERATCDCYHVVASEWKRLFD
jgi:CRP-like cAMP-binding protein